MPSMDAWWASLVGSLPVLGRTGGRGWPQLILWLGGVVAFNLFFHLSPQ